MRKLVLGEAVKREIAVLASVDPRTVAKVVAGEPVEGLARERVDAVLKRLGLREAPAGSEGSFLGVPMRQTGAHLDLLKAKLGDGPPTVQEAARKVADLQKAATDLATAREIAVEDGHLARLVKATMVETWRSELDAAETKAESLVVAAKDLAGRYAVEFAGAVSGFRRQQLTTEWNVAHRVARAACLQVVGICNALLSVTQDAVEAAALGAKANTWISEAAGLRETTGVND